MIRILGIQIHQPVSSPKLQFVLASSQVTFEGVAGDGYMSDIALDNIVFTVDGQCSTYPPEAVSTISGTS